jgi:hypothetical protein
MASVGSQFQLVPQSMLRQLPQQSRGQARTANFTVFAADQQTADLVAGWAEHYRKEKAVQWLGQELPAWGRPCPVQVTVKMEGTSGATSFAFDQGVIRDMKMEIDGPLDRMIASTLPHEVTHTVFASYFRQPLPRWCDEGGAVLMENDVELIRHDKMTRQILNQGGQYSLRALFNLRDYPRDGNKVMTLYAQGFSVCHYLTAIGNQRQFLGFVAAGMQGQWDQACKSIYNLNRVEDLEAAWLKHLQQTKGTPITQVANCFTRPTPSAPRPTLPAVAVAPAATAVVAPVAPPVITPAIAVQVPLPAPAPAAQSAATPKPDPFAASNGTAPSLQKITTDVAGLAAQLPQLQAKLEALAPLAAQIPDAISKIQNLSAGSGSPPSLPTWLLPAIAGLGALTLPGPISKILSGALAVGSAVAKAATTSVPASIPTAGSGSPVNGATAGSPPSSSFAAPVVLQGAAPPQQTVVRQNYNTVTADSPELVARRQAAAMLKKQYPNSNIPELLEAWTQQIIAGQQPGGAAA